MKHAHGRERTALYNRITANLKKIAEARKRVGAAMTKARQDQLQFAVDQAAAAAANAIQGSKKWDQAIAAEEKALRAEIRYWDKRAHNHNLSIAARDAAARKEIAYQKQLRSLTTAQAQAVTANEAQFLQSYLDIQNTFGGNTVPLDTGGGGKKTDTHLYDIKNESRETNKHLRAIRDRGRFPGSRMGFDSAMAAATS